MEEFAIQKNKEAESSVVVQQDRAMAEVQAQVVLAKKYPRDPERARELILAECTRLGVAEQAEYQFSRGGTDITGPSIRLMELMAKYWTNIAYGLIELERKNGESTVLAYAWDLETNVRATVEFKARHWRDTKSGGYEVTAERDVYEITMNMGSRRLRSCLQRVLPGNLVDDALEQCHKTIGAIKEPNRVENMLNKFLEFGVTKEMIERKIQRKIEAITGQNMIELVRIYNSIQDGMSEPKDWFIFGEAPKESTSQKAMSAVQNAIKETNPFKKKQDEKADYPAVQPEGENSNELGIF